MASDPTDFASVGPSIGRTGGAAVCSAGLRAHRAALCSAERTYMEPTVFAVDGTTIGHDGVAAICSAKLTAVDPTTFAAVSPPSSMTSLELSARTSSRPSSWPWGQVTLQPSAQPTSRLSLQRCGKPISMLRSQAQGLHSSVQPSSGASSEASSRPHSGLLTQPTSFVLSQPGSFAGVVPARRPGPPTQPSTQLS